MPARQAAELAAFQLTAATWRGASKQMQHRFALPSCALSPDVQPEQPGPRSAAWGHPGNNGRSVHSVLEGKACGKVCGPNSIRDSHPPCYLTPDPTHLKPLALETPAAAERSPLQSCPSQPLSARSGDGAGCQVRVGSGTSKRRAGCTQLRCTGLTAAACQLPRRTAQLACSGDSPCSFRM